jgi:hypothetical protein
MYHAGNEVGAIGLLLGLGPVSACGGIARDGGARERRNKHQRRAHTQS